MLDNYYSDLTQNQIYKFIWEKEEVWVNYTSLKINFDGPHLILFYNATSNRDLADRSKVGYKVLAGYLDELQWVDSHFSILNSSLS